MYAIVASPGQASVAKIPTCVAARFRSAIARSRADVRRSTVRLSFVIKLIYILIMCTKPGNRTPEKFFLAEVGLQGVTSQQAEVGRHIFAGLKFTETSYKQDGSKFNLVVALVSKQESDLHPMVIACSISPPIYVDSRFRSIDTQKEKQPMNSNVFFPDMFTKEMTKRKKETEEEITNDMNGFVSYFTAPNIRYKIKNPLFLAYKFSNFVTIYYNTLRCRDAREAVRQVMAYFTSMVALEKPKCYSRRSGNNIDKINMDALICMAFRKESEPKSLREVVDKYGPFDNGFMNILCDSSLIPKRFAPINEPDHIRIFYEEYYANKDTQPLMKRPRLMEGSSKALATDSPSDDFAAPSEHRPTTHRIPCRTVIDISRKPPAPEKQQVAHRREHEMYFVKCQEQTPVLNCQPEYPSLMSSFASYLGMLESTMRHPYL